MVSNSSDEGIPECLSAAPKTNSSLSIQEICTGAGPAIVTAVKLLTSVFVFCPVSAANAIPAIPPAIVLVTTPSPSTVARW